MAAISGELIRVSAQNKSVLAFVSHSNSDRKELCSNALVLIPGLTDGMMTMSYTHALNSSLLSIDYSLVQVNLSTSFCQFGLHSLETDVQELTLIIQYLKEQLHFNKLILLGHSTGCQDVLSLLRHSPAAASVTAIILQGAVSDRDGMVLDDTTPGLLREARDLADKGCPGRLLSDLYCDAPITAERFLSLAGRLTPDDMFSCDLTCNELEPILAPIRVPVLLCYSQQDEYVPNIAAQKESSQRMVDTLTSLGNTSVIDRVYIPGDHGLSGATDYSRFVEKVVSFISQYC